jgi:hypothetical protein
VCSFSQKDTTIDQPNIEKIRVLLSAPTDEVGQRIFKIVFIRWPLSSIE